jgi:hypothetical protein
LISWGFGALPEPMIEPAETKSSRSGPTNPILE